MMNTYPTVSIITPFFNAEAFFEEMIKSVLAQTYTYWELLLIDDGSIDNSTAIAKSYAAQYPGKIHYLDHEGHQNQGKSTSRNLGIQQSQGDYIAMLDADDIFLPQKLEKQVALLEAYPEAGMVYGPTLYWHSWTGKSSDQQRDYLAGLGVKANTLVQPPHLLTLYLSNGGVVPCTCGLLVRRELAKKVGGFSETIQHMYEDQVFIAKICLNASVFIGQDCWDKYRQHDASSSSIAIRNGEYHPQKLNVTRLKFLNWLGIYLADNNIQDLDLWRAYRRSMWPYEHPKLAKITLPLIYFAQKNISRLTIVIKHIFLV